MTSLSKARQPFRWAGICLLYFVVSYASYLLDYTVTQPHPHYLDGTTWLGIAAREGLFFSLEFAFIIAMLVPIGLAVQKPPRDMAYYPVPRHARGLLHSSGSRLMVICGLLLLAGYIGLTAIDVWKIAQSSHGLLWPPHYIYAVCMVFWGVLWIADCLNRPRRGSIVAAVLYTALAVFFTLSAAVTLVE